MPCCVKAYAQWNVKHDSKQKSLTEITARIHWIRRPEPLKSLIDEFLFHMDNSTLLLHENRSGMPATVLSSVWTKANQAM